jgi:hypothetical protein
VQSDGAQLARLAERQLCHAEADQHQQDRGLEVGALGDGEPL